ncbi:hypothetical protein NY78_1494 [Desulfovibrio sp. TomC]|nr:hypothetical protein NY78_1494 [Desulfovibrio sp. TomC]
MDSHGGSPARRGRAWQPRPDAPVGGFGTGRQCAPALSKGL